jgi:protein SCO1/2
VRPHHRLTRLAKTRAVDCTSLSGSMKRPFRYRLVAMGAAALALGGQCRRVPSREAPARRAAAQAADAGNALPVLWQVPSFSFPDQHGKPTAAADLRGHVWIANFIFTRCTTVCPLITAKMVLLQRRLGDQSLRFVSFSVDPERDTPQALRRYASEWRRADESRWSLISTTAAGLERLAAGMYVAVQPSENDINHTRMFFLVDARGAVRGIYESDKHDAVERLVRDTEALAGPSPRAEATAGTTTGATTGPEIYAALGCGACHARRDLAPSLGGLPGRRVELEGGAVLHADSAYVRESIVAPDAKIVAGYAVRMPSYEHELAPGQLDALVEHIARMTPEPPPANEPVAAAARTAGSATDPVCSMKVRVADGTPHANHAGHTYRFCSELCRDRFVAEPARFLRAVKR